MRIISGKFRGRHFNPPTNITARPTTDFAKESLFNLLAGYIEIEGITALDLFSGTGSISYELSSRDASHITAIEMSERHITYIKKICNELKIDNIRILRQDVFRYINSCSNTFDFIFADPPYQLEEIGTIPDLILQRNLLNPDGLLVVEHGVKTSFDDHPNLILHRNYGNVHFSFFAPNPTKETK